MNETASVLPVLYLATLPAFLTRDETAFVLKILVLLGVLTMNETAVVPFTLLFLATLEAFFHWPLVRRLVYRILSAVALITIGLGCLCRIGEQLDIAVLQRLETQLVVMYFDAVMYCLPGR